MVKKEEEGEENDGIKEGCKSLIFRVIRTKFWLIFPNGKIINIENLPLNNAINKIYDVFDVKTL